ncbi:MAG: aminomethyl-transferring glycine dehydrogenase subunit GcvPA [Thermoplasmata archaeon]|nr:aminomethyl-transferring glycine dehydrogenase subunit GcvPA [Thermoplasmata archaeon]
MPRWIPSEDGEEAALLRELGIASTEELFADVPRKARMGRLGVGAGLDERGVVETIDGILEKNRPYTQFASFLGGRFPTRYVPAAVDAILSRSEFYTSYTPYQPEASQGILQSLFEFQSLWVELTGMDAANASLYDGATAAGEALLLSRRIHPGERFLIPASLPWEEKSVLANYGGPHGVRLEEIPFDHRTGCLDLGAFRTAVLKGDVFGALVDLPNGFGGLDEGLPELKGILGEVPLTVVADPLALTVLEAPGSWGADIVVGEGQGFGATPSFGGPLLGLFACRRAHLRLSPGRIVGATQDRDGRRAFTLTLQTREQHIRRSRATSNICTNQSLLALAFLTYASTVGPRGLAQLAAQLHARAEELATALRAVPGLKVPRFDAPHLADVPVEVAHGTATEFLERLRGRKVLGGVPLADPRPAKSGDASKWFLASATEWTDARSIAKYAAAAETSAGATS